MIVQRKRKQGIASKGGHPYAYIQKHCFLLDSLEFIL